MRKIKTYYHVTFVNRFSKILEYGIIPGKPTIWMNRYGRRLGNKKVIYAHADYETAFRWAFKQAWDFKKQPVIISFKEYTDEMIPHVNLLGMEEYTKEGKIEPEQIVDVFDPIEEQVWNR